MPNKPGRKKKCITKDMMDEVDEIIELKIKDINGVLNKLTSNSVWQFNKKIANNPDFLNSKGKMFTLYSSDFWSAKYNNNDNYGKAQIQYYKNDPSKKSLFINEFDQSIEDIVLAVNNLHSKPNKLIQVLQNIYLEKNHTIEILQNSNDELKDFINKQNKLITEMENAMYNIFFASRDARNSLRDVISLKKTKDWFVAEELNPLVGSRKDFLELLKSPENKKTGEIIDFNKKLKQLEDDGL